jgi:hypothetical protein
MYTSHKESKGGNHMPISIDAEKASDKIQHPFMIKGPEETRNKRNVPDTIKPLYDKL